MYSGHFELALHYFNESNAFDSEGPGVQAINMSSGLGNKATLFVTLGRLAEAHHTATEAIRYAMQGGDTLRTVLCHAYRGWAATLSGQVRPAAEDLVLINEVKKRFPDTVGDHSLRGFRWIELLLLTGHSDLANYATRSNLRMCERNRWNDSIALCHWLLGWCALIEGNLNVAEAKLDEAEPILRRGQLLFELARLQVTAGQVAVARRKAEGALDRAAEALALAAPRGMRLVHADALVLRGRARMIEVQADSAGRALDDAEEALRLARECGYAWGERDALFLAADARAALGAGHHSAGNTLAAEREHDSSRRARADADALAARLVLTKEDLAEADAKAAVWLNEWKETEGEE
jgi:tetratricopeptide (TPR) repeat protein